MPAPATTGQLRTTVRDMVIGDFIYGYYDNQSSSWGIGLQIGDEYPVTGIPVGSFRSGWFYFVKVEMGLLVADRVVQTNRSWVDFNGTKVIQGRPEPASRWQVDGVLRSLTGGVAYVDAKGNLSLTEQGYGGFPTNNEWDRYIMGFKSELIQSGKTLNDVFNYISTKTWTQDTAATGLIVAGGSPASPTSRVVRGYTTNTSGLAWHSSTYADSTIGFRPVFEYKEV